MDETDIVSTLFFYCCHSLIGLFTGTDFVGDRLDIKYKPRPGRGYRPNAAPFFRSSLKCTYTGGFWSFQVKKNNQNIAFKVLFSEGFLSCFLFLAGGLYAYFPQQGLDSHPAQDVVSQYTEGPDQIIGVKFTRGPALQIQVGLELTMKLLAGRMATIELDDCFVIVFG